LIRYFSFLSFWKFFVENIFKENFSLLKCFSGVFWRKILWSLFSYFFLQMKCKFSLFYQPLSSISILHYLVDDLTLCVELIIIISAFGYFFNKY
jgi:CDP-diglyceride synthetase